MYSEYLWVLQAEVKRLGLEYVESMTELDADNSAFHRLYGIGLTLWITKEWNQHWADYFANATRDYIIHADILEHFDFLND